MTAGVIVQYYDAREKEETAEIMKVLHQQYQGKET